MNLIYCDHSATTYVKKEVLKEMEPYYAEKYGNPSSLYKLGRTAKSAIERAREQVANSINANTNEIYFTSCGSESDNLAIKGFCYANRKNGNHIITSKIEHPAVLNTCKVLERQGYNVTYLDVARNGFINLEELNSKINMNTILISIMMANNEIGTIQRIKEIGQIAHNKNIVFHTDAVQAIGNIKVDVKNMNIDMLSLSAHKFYGPKGVGALYVRNGVIFNRIQDGGYQEQGKRAGTENTAGIVGLGKAIELANNNIEQYNRKLSNLREYFIKKIGEVIDTSIYRINGDRVNRLPGNVSISFKGEDSSNMLIELEKNGIYASGGSACCSSSNEPSHVLTAIGLTKEWIDGTIRFTFGEENSKDDIDYIVDVIKRILNRW